MAKINKQALITKMNKEVGPIVAKEALRRVRRSVESAHQKMIQEFENHPITKEISSGPEGYNQSGTLGGYGNLFSYIGFEEGMDPIQPIRRLLSKTLNIKSIPSNHKSMMMKFLVELPSKEEIFQASPMPWASGRSWAEGIERGISGFGQYLNTQSFSSRSGEGVQTKNKVRTGGFNNTKYLSAILNNLRKHIQEGMR